MKICVNNRCSDFNSYRAARVKSLFNVESGCNFSLEADLPVDDSDWRLGLIVGPSGSGKTSMGRKMFGGGRLLDLYQGWPDDRPIIDAIAPEKSLDAVTGALAAVGLGTVPAWLRPFRALSNGEQFRAGLAKVICDAPEKAIIDEFSSVVDRQIAKFGALAFQKAWKRQNGQCVLLSCHYDVIEWLEPDWIYDTGTGKFSGRGLCKRPRFDLEIWETDGSYWKAFERHHYLKLPKMIAAKNYLGRVEGELVAHVAFSPKLDIGGMRACRLVVMPEWQGAGVGLRFLEAICEIYLSGDNKWKKRLPTYFHTSHPGLCAALRRSRNWVQKSAVLFGGNKKRSARSMSQRKCVAQTGYGGHFRAVQGFKYVGLAENAKT